MLSTDLPEALDRDGFVIVRQAIDQPLAAELVEHVHWLDRKHPDLRPESFHHKVLLHDPFIHRVAGDPRLLDIAAQFVGQDIGLYASHYIAKPPGTGRAVGWHQDGSYWPLEPMKVVTLWVAGTESTSENGCMRVIAGSQHDRLLKKSDLMELDQSDYVLNAGMRPEQVDEQRAVDIELAPGDVSIHNPMIIHGSNPNRSEKWRVGLTLRYIPTSTHVTAADHECMLLRGRPTKGVANTYVPRPHFDADQHMRFAGCEAWG